MQNEAKGNHLTSQAVWQHRITERDRSHSVYDSHAFSLFCTVRLCGIAPKGLYP